MDPTTARDSYEAALDFLFQRIDYERAVAAPYGDRAFKLDRMSELLALLDNPQSRLPIVHIAGTKGKGSTSAMIAAILSAAGYRTGLFSSPHLDRLEERMAVDGHPCSPEELVELVDLLRPAVAQLDQAASRRRPQEPGPTYFELTTAMALLHFVRRGVQAAVLEVGLGGRLDSTNVCLPAVSVITNISFDHMRQLGNTLAAIAREKAGIIKPGVSVVSGVVEDEPRAVIEEISHERGCPLLQLERDFHYEYAPPRDVDHEPARGTMDYRLAIASRRRAHEKIALGLLGRHQAGNAAVALTAIDELARQGWQISEAAIRRGLGEVRWPARVEVAARRPAVILDTAHNVASIEALVATLAESFSARERILVFATTREKEVETMLRRLLPQFDRIILTQYQNNPRGVPPEELAAIASQTQAAAVRVCPTPAAAWEAVHSLAGEKDLVCITGSFFIAAEMRAQIEARPLQRAENAVLEPT